MVVIMALRAADETHEGWESTLAASPEWMKRMVSGRLETRG